MEMLREGVKLRIKADAAAYFPAAMEPLSGQCQRISVVVWEWKSAFSLPLCADLIVML